MDNEQEYITITQVASELGWNKATVYDWIKTLGIQTHRFVRNKNTFLHITDVARLKEIKEKPWTAGPNTARTARRVTEKAEKPPVLAPVKTPKVVTEKAPTRDYKARDTGLPAGCILALDFARNHNVKRETFRDHMVNGLGPGLIGMSTDTIPERDHVEHETRPKPGRESRGETERYLTAEQQHEAIAFWRRHDVAFIECNQAGCYCHNKGE
jgi:hypothetical protein